MNQVTVLIGIAWKGRAVAGVVNQPFYKLEEPEGYKGRCIWGIEGHGTDMDITLWIEVFKYYF